MRIEVYQCMHQAVFRARDPNDHPVKSGSRRFIFHVLARKGPHNLLPGLLHCRVEEHILGEVTLIAAHRRSQLLQRLAVPAHLPGQPDDTAIGLKLRERGLEQGRGAGPAGQPVRFTAML